MIEVVVLASLIALGIMVSTKKDDPEPLLTPENAWPARDVFTGSDRPSAHDPYHSTHTAVADAQARARIAANVAKYNNHTQQLTHNNMTPFFGGSVKQNVTDTANGTLLESFTGVGDTLRSHKCEATSLCDVRRNVSNVYGTPNQGCFMQSRMVAPVARRNELPIAAQRVGPGLGLGYTTTPSGGFQQASAQDIARDGTRTVDQLRAQAFCKQSAGVDPFFAMGLSDNQRRVASEPTMEAGLRLPGGSRSADAGVQTAGVAGIRRGERYGAPPEAIARMPTAGGNAQAASGDIVGLTVIAPSKDPQRATTSTEITGPAGPSEGRPAALPCEVRENARDAPRRYGLDIQPLQPGIVSGVVAANTVETDAVSASRPTERGLVRHGPAQGGGLVALVKAIVAPLQDAARSGRKLWTEDAPSPGAGGLAGPIKLPVHDPNDVAKTTIKETLIHDDDGAPPSRGTISTASFAPKATVWNPNDVAKTTIKETLIHDADPTRGTVTFDVPRYDPDDPRVTETRRVTIKQTLLAQDRPSLSVRGHKTSTRDPSAMEVAPTIRANVVGSESSRPMGGNPDALQKAGPTPAEAAPHHTQKETLLQDDYVGIAGAWFTRLLRLAGVVHDRTPAPRPTAQDYVGESSAPAYLTKPASLQTTGDPTRKHAADARETTAVANATRAPTTSGVKSANDSIPAATQYGPRLLPAGGASFVSPPNAVASSGAPECLGQTMRMASRPGCGTSDRLDPSMMDALKSNPYALSVVSRESL
jgi:hypothetical protein